MCPMDENGRHPRGTKREERRTEKEERQGEESIACLLHILFRPALFQCRSCVAAVLATLSRFSALCLPIIPYP